MFVADTGHQRLKYTAIASLPGTPVWSELGYLSDPSAAAALEGVQGVAVDAAGNVYAVDAFAGEVQLYRYDPVSGAYAYDDAFASATRHTVAGLPITFPRDIAVGADGRVYLLDSGNNRILVASGPTATALSVWHVDASWLNSYGLDVARDGTVYVADTGNSRIVKIAPDGRRPSSEVTEGPAASSEALATWPSATMGASSWRTRSITEFPSSIGTANSRAISQRRRSSRRRRR